MTRADELEAQLDQLTTTILIPINSSTSCGSSSPRCWAEADHSRAPEEILDRALEPQWSTDSRRPALLMNGP